MSNLTIYALLCAAVQSLAFCEEKKNTLNKRLSLPFSVIGPSNVSAAPAKQRHEARFLHNVTVFTLKL